MFHRGVEKRTEKSINHAAEAEAICAALRSGNAEGGVEQQRRCLAARFISPEDYGSVFRLALEQMVKEGTVEMIEQLIHLFWGEGSLAGHYRRAAEELALGKRSAEAHLIMDRSLTMPSSEHPFFLAHQMRTLAILGRTDEAIALCRQVLSLGREGILICLGEIGVVARGGKDHEAAAAILWTEVLQHDPQDIELSLKFAEHLHRQGRVEQLVALLRALLDLSIDGQLLQSCVTHARLLRQEGNEDHSLALWGKIVAVSPERGRAYRRFLREVDGGETVEEMGARVREKMRRRLKEAKIRR